MTRQIALPATARREILVANHYQRADLIAYARKAHKRGDILILANRPIWIQEKQRWELPIVRYREVPERRQLAPAWVWAAAVCMGFMLVLWWVLTTLAIMPLIVLCMTALLGLFIIVRAGARRRRSVSVTTVTTVNVR